VTAGDSELLPKSPVLSATPVVIALPGDVAEIGIVFSLTENAPEGELVRRTETSGTVAVAPDQTLRLVIPAH
jgi:hypothetical protein